MGGREGRGWMKVWIWEYLTVAQELLRVQTGTYRCPEMDNNRTSPINTHTNTAELLLQWDTLVPAPFLIVTCHPNYQNTLGKGIQPKAYIWSFFHSDIL